MCALYVVKLELIPFLFLGMELQVVLSFEFEASTDFFKELQQPTNKIVNIFNPLNFFFNDLV